MDPARCLTILLVMAMLVCWTWTMAHNTCSTTEVVATSSYQTISYNMSEEQNCVWIIRGFRDTDVIGIKVVDWFTSSGFSCTRDRLVIRDGSQLTSPSLRVLCGVSCGVFNDDVEVVTSSNAARVVYVPFQVQSSRPHGFTLVYRSLAYYPVSSVRAMYSTVNYVLMCVSVLLIGGLTGGLLFLFLRELGIIRRKKHQKMLDKLKRRRAGFSGQSGLPIGHLSNSLPDANACHIDPATPVSEEDYSVCEEAETSHGPLTEPSSGVSKNVSHKALGIPDLNHLHQNGKVTSQPLEMTYAKANGHQPRDSRAVQ